MANKVKNVPELRFPEFSSEWEENILGDVVIIKSGWSPSNFEKKDASVLLIKVDDLNYSSRMINNSKLKVNENNKYKKIKKDSIIFPKRGAAILTNKVRILGIDSYMDSNMMALEPKTINSEFLFTFIGKTGLYKIADTSTIPQINNKHIEPYNILLPSSTEQKYIGDFFSKLDRQIELEEQKLAKLEEQKKGYMQKIFSQELRFKDDNGNEYPEWQFKNLGELGETFTGLSGKTKDDFGYGDGLFITYMNVFKNTIAKSDIVERVKIGSNENQNRVQYGDILFTTSSEVPNEVGMSSIWLFNQDNVYLNSFCFGFRVFVNYIKPVYLARYLRSEEMRKTITILAQGSTRFNISKKEMMKLNIKVPYIEEQIKIDNFFNKIDILILEQGKKIEILKHRKKGLLQKMFV